MKEVMTMLKWFHFYRCKAYKKIRTFFIKLKYGVKVIVTYRNLPLTERLEIAKHIISVIDYIPYHR